MGKEATNETLYGKGLLHEFDGNDRGPGRKRRNRGPLNERHLISPFSVWNSRDDFWQVRRAKWLELGIRSEEGRKDALTYNIPMYLSDGSKGAKIRAQTSIFDPFLAEVCYSWWAPPGGIILDPFAGGSVRGVVASVLGFKYWGCELRAEQVAANKEQLTDKMVGQWRPIWRCGDSLVEVPARAPGADFVFSCPPYGPLETYSDDPADISNMTYEQFLTPYGQIIEAACGKLLDNRFAAFVVANFRDKKTGYMHDFVGDTVRAFERCPGVRFYNEITFINSVGTGAMRANTSFVRGARKMVKTHQNVLVFIKGDPKEAAKHVPVIGEIDENMPLENLADLG